MKDNKIIVTQFEAARRQLDTAIELFFAERDEVAIHTLAAAAHQLLHDLNKKNKGPALLFDASFINKEYRKSYISFLKQSANFFKHADNRGKAKKQNSIEFVPFSNEIFILFSITAIEYLGKKLTDIEEAFMFWLRFNRTHLLTTDGQQFVENHIPSNAVNDIRSIPKREFLEHFMDAKRLG